jgi:hypothetical protein
VISINCLNLPPKKQNLISNTYIAGITPGPDAPTTNTINHCLHIIVDELLLLNRGINLNTQLFSQGRRVRVQLLPLLGDIVGVHKVAGYTSHSATFFCSWCKIMKKDLESLKLGAPWSSEETLQDATKWRNLQTISRREEAL